MNKELLCYQAASMISDHERAAAFAIRRGWAEDEPDFDANVEAFESELNRRRSQPTNNTGLRSMCDLAKKSQDHGG